MGFGLDSRGADSRRAKRAAARRESLGNWKGERRLAEAADQWRHERAEGSGLGAAHV
jgi:hypothetical protein